MFRAPYRLLNQGYVESSSFGTGLDSIRRAQEVSKRIILTPGENYTMSSGEGDVITAIDEDVDIIGDNSTFTLVQGADSLVDIAGTYSDTIDVSAITSNVLTVPAGIGSLVKGDVLKMADGLTPPWWVMGRTRRGEFDGSRRTGEHGVVRAASGTSITLAATPKWASNRVPDYLKAILRTDISNVANNGSGLCRVTTSHPHFYTTGLNVCVESVVGATEANGTRPVTVIDSTTYDIVGSSAPSAYVSGGTSYMAATYSTHASAAFKVGKLRSGLCRVRIGRVLCASTVTSHGTLIRASVRQNIDWGITYIQRSASYIFAPMSCFGGKVEYYADGTGPANTGYIATMIGGDNIIVKINGSGTTRHSIDGGLAGTANGLTGLAASGPASHMNIYVEGYNIGSTQAAHATHDGTDSWTWHFPKARQTPANVAVRGVGHTVIGGRSSGTGDPGGDDEGDDTGPADGGAFSTFAQFYIGVVSSANNGSGAIRLTVDGRAGRGPDLITGMKVRVAQATDASAASTNGYFYITMAGTTVVDGHTYYLVDLDGSTFVSSSGAENALIDAGLDACDDFRVMYCSMEDNPSTMVGGSGNGGSMLIKSCYFSGTGTPSGVITAGRSLKLYDTDFDFSGTPGSRLISTSAFTDLVDINGVKITAATTLPHIVDINEKTNSVRILMRNVHIYNPNGAVASLYRNAGFGGTGLPSAGSRFGNIWIYGTLTAPASGKTWDDLAAFVDGPIYVNGVLVAGPTPAPGSRKLVPWGYTSSDNGVTQATSKSTGVTQNGYQGRITMNAATLVAGTRVNFTFTNNIIRGGDTLLINHEATGNVGDYHVAGSCDDGSANVGVRNLTAGDLSEAIILRYKVVKGENG